MKELSEKSFVILEGYCDYAGKIAKNTQLGVSRKQLEKVKENLTFEKMAVYEGNFVYLYEAVSNFEEMFGAGCKILDIKEDFARNEYSNIVKLVKEYKVKIKSGAVFYLNVSYDFVQTSITSMFYPHSEGFHMPIYVCHSLSIYLWQNGFRAFVKDKTYNLNSEYQIDNLYMREIFKNLNLEIKYSNGPYYEFQVYDNEKLVSENNVGLKDVITNLLVDMVQQKKLQSKDLKFKKEVVVEEEEVKEVFDVNVCFEILPGCKGYYVLKCKTQKSICTLTNDSGIKIVIMKYLNCLEDNKMSVLDFINNVLRKANKDDVYCVNFLLNTVTDSKSRILKLKSGEEVRVNKREPVIANNVLYELKNEGNIFLPKNISFEDSYLTKCKLLNEKLFDDNNKVFLVQYFSAQALFGKSTYNIILRMVYQFKDTTYTFCDNSLQNVLIPYVDFNRSRVIVLDKDENLNSQTLNKKQFYRTYSIYLSSKISGSSVDRLIFEHYYGKDAKFDVYSLVEGVDFFEQSEEIDFAKKKQVDFTDLFKSHMLFNEIKEEVSDEIISTIQNLYK